MELHNLPYVVHRELLPLLGIKDKQTLRQVSHRLRDLIDTQQNIHFNVTLSDDTSSIVLKFNYFDLLFLPRILHRLNVTTLLAPLTFASTYSALHPLPPSINTLAFKGTRGISQVNFIKLVDFYGKTDSLMEVQLDLLCLEKVESAKNLSQGILNRNMIRKLELVFPTSMDLDIECAHVLLGGTYPSLDTLKINLNPYGCYHPVLYKLAFLMISRHLPGLITLEVNQPFVYHHPDTLPQLINRNPGRILLPYEDMDIFNQVRDMEANLADVHQALQPFLEFHNSEDNGKIFEKFLQGCETLKKISLSFSVHETNWNRANLGLLLVNCQKKLEFLELSVVSLPNPAETATADVTRHPLNLTKITQNCSSTLVTLKLFCLISPSDDSYQFNLEQFESCHRLEIFIFRTLCWQTRQVRFSHVGKLPQSLRHLELPAQVLDEDLHRIRDRLINLKSFMFGHQTPGVTLPQLQILMGDEGIPNLEQVTLIEGFYEAEPIGIWASDPQNRITMTKITTERLNTVVFKRQATN